MTSGRPPGAQSRSPPSALKAPRRAHLVEEAPDPPAVRRHVGGQLPRDQHQQQPLQDVDPEGGPHPRQRQQHRQPHQCPEDGHVVRDEGVRAGGREAVGPRKGLNPPQAAAAMEGHEVAHGRGLAQTHRTRPNQGSVHRGHGTGHSRAFPELCATLFWPKPPRQTITMQGIGRTQPAAFVVQHLRQLPAPTS